LKGQQQSVITELPRWMGHVSLGAVIPDGYMTRYIDNASFAGYLEFMYRAKQNQPIFFGLSMARTTFQKESVEYLDFVDGVSIKIKEKTASRFNSVAMNIRFQPELNWFLQPYVQGQIGWHYVYSNTKFRDVDANETFDLINEAKSNVLGYGLQAGIQIIPNFWYIRGDIRLSYLRNAAVDFLAKDQNSFSSIPIENFIEQNAPISLIFIHAGVSYFF
jgi:hypothetical protein